MERSQAQTYARTAFECLEHCFGYSYNEISPDSRDLRPPSQKGMKIPRVLSTIRLLCSQLSLVSDHNCTLLAPVGSDTL